MTSTFSSRLIPVVMLAVLVSFPGIVIADGEHDAHDHTAEAAGPHAPDQTESDRDRLGGEHEHAHETTAPDGHELQVLVTDGPNGPRVEGAQVRLTSLNPDANLIRYTDVEGHVSFSLPTGLYRVDAGDDMRPYARTFVALQSNQAIAMALEPVIASGTLVGTVTDEAAGTPIEGAIVRVTGSAALTHQFPAVVKADTTGSFKLDLPSGMYAIQVQRAPMYGKDVSMVAIVAGHETHQDVQLAPADTTLHPLRGRVVDANDLEPIPNVTVLAAPPDQIDVGPIHLATASDGHFAGWLPEGPYTVRVWADGYYQVSRDIHLEGGFEAILLEAQRTAVEEPVAVRVKVVDEHTGSAIAKARVMLTGQHEGQALSTKLGVTDDTGVYQDEIHADDRTELVARIRAPGYPEQEVALAMQGGSVSATAKISDGMESSFRVLTMDPEGRPIDLGPVYASADDGTTVRMAGYGQSGSYAARLEGTSCHAWIPADDQGIRQPLVASGRCTDQLTITVQENRVPAARLAIRVVDSAATQGLRLLVAHGATGAWADEPVAAGTVTMETLPGTHDILLYGPSTEARWARIVVGRHDDAQRTALATAPGTSPHAGHVAMSLLDLAPEAQGTLELINRDTEEAPLAINPLLAMLAIGSMMARGRRTNKAHNTHHGLDEPPTPSPALWA